MTDDTGASDLGGRGYAMADSGAGGGALGASAQAGFWLPAALRARLLSNTTRWEQARFARGRECESGYDASGLETVTVSWPVFAGAQLAELLSGLRAARERAPRGPEYWARLTAALAVATGRFSDPTDPYHHALLRALPSCTGFSPGMIAATLGTADPWNLDKVVPALRYQPSKDCSARWQKMPGLPGRVRFFPRTAIGELAGWVPVSSEMPLYGADTRLGFVLGYAAGDIPGIAFTMMVLALSATLRGENLLPAEMPPPAVLVRCSRQEPVATPLILSAIEEVDPDLVAMVASAVWDLDDAVVQERLEGEADLVLAAGDRDFIERVSTQATAIAHGRRFHAHENGVGFSVIGREVLEPQSGDDAGEWRLPGGADIIDIVALLAGLDSSFWDQNDRACRRGCTSWSKCGPADDLPAEYARRLTARLRQIAMVMPAGRVAGRGTFTTRSTATRPSRAPTAGDRGCG